MRNQTNIGSTKKNIPKEVLEVFHAGVLLDATPVWRSVLRQCVARYYVGMTSKTVFHCYLVGCRVSINCQTSQICRELTKIISIPA